MTTPAQQTELEKPVTRVAYFARFDFKSGTARFCSFSKTIKWGGFDWVGTGQLGAITDVEEAQAIEPKQLTFTLNAIDPSWLTLAMGPVEDYRGRKAYLYMCPLDEGYQPVDTPELCWQGEMELMSLGIDKKDAAISLRCESALYGMKRKMSYRMNAAQLRKMYPGAAGFDYLADLIGNPIVWLSKAFQRI